jgi:lysophospholipase L1-like esterase
VFTKRLLPDEEGYLKLGGYEPARWDPAIREARRLLKDTPFVDLGNALDGAQEPVLWDFVHTNELGANLTARALFTNLKPTLVRNLRAVAAP